jgi:hypothetical protein
MDPLLADLRYTVRLLRKTPVFTLVAAGTLALGIGANTAMFSIVDSVILKRLPFGDPDRLGMVWEDGTLVNGFARNQVAPGNYTDWRKLNRSFTDLAATAGASASLTGDGAPERVLGDRVTANFFTVLGLQPQPGRGFTEEEDRNGAPVVVISHALWQRRYGGETSVIGRRVLSRPRRSDGRAAGGVTSQHSPQRPRTSDALAVGHRQE